MKKRERLKAIEELMESKKISSQEELVKELKRKGCNITQSTISRDLYELRVIKVRNHLGEEYYSSESRFRRDSMFNFEKLSSKFRSSVLSVMQAKNILVIKTYPGEAQGTAAVIDGMNFVEILGTVAGDDTVISVSDSEEHAGSIKEFMEKQ